MSQHIFRQSKDGKHYEIQLGWDKPTQSYYGHILGWLQTPYSPDEGYYDDPVWDSFCESLQPWPLEDIAANITKRGFTLPQHLLEAVALDGMLNTVNEITFYDNDRAEIEKDWQQQQAVSNDNTPDNNLYHPDCLPF